MCPPPEDIRGGADPGRFWGEYSSARTARSSTRTRAPEPDTAGPGAAANGSAAPGPEAADPASAHECLDWCPICRGAEVLRAGAPPELRDQLQTVQRDSLMMLRALIDTYLERPHQHPPPPRAGDDGVEDIPIG